MANDPQDFVRIEEALATKLTADFEARTGGVAEAIATCVHARRFLARLPAGKRDQSQWHDCVQS